MIITPWSDCEVEVTVNRVSRPEGLCGICSGPAHIVVYRRIGVGRPCVHSGLAVVCSMRVEWGLYWNQIYGAQI